MDSTLAYRIQKSHTAEVCRLCLKTRYLVDINVNHYLRMQMMECFPQTSLDDGELPRFVCGECYQLVEITYQFSVRMRRTEVLLRSYVHMGGEFPRPETLDAEYHRARKRSASPDLQGDDNPPSKKGCSSKESSRSGKEKRHTSHNKEKKSQSAREPSRSQRKERKTPNTIGESTCYKKNERQSSKNIEKKYVNSKGSSTQSHEDVFWFGEAVENRNDFFEEAESTRTKFVEPLRMSYDEKIRKLQENCYKNIQKNQSKCTC
ncbi:uncharacterized protein LOC134220543 [Armigeres subalbatus]|uniref:uncharacterized protein LOC134220543 n=1 Tax=Armigeres subalbatus TaxID=124917 RepID=UPI002ED43AEA